MSDRQSFKRVSYADTKDLILNYHYAKRMPTSVMHAFGMFDGDELIGVCTFGMPAASKVCEGLVGKQHAKRVLELNRLVLKYNMKNQASQLIGYSLRSLPEDLLIISYADGAQGHVGIVYQATNWLYVGLTAVRTDRVFTDGTTTKHGRHVVSTEVDDLFSRTVLVPRPRKHRYVYATGKKRAMLRHLRYPTQPYPEGVTK